MQQARRLLLPDVYKRQGSDQANQKSTFVALKGIAACEAWVQELTQEAVAFLAPFSGREFLCELAHFLARRTK